MILIATNADFSANAIEKINIQRELSEFSQNVFSKMTKYKPDSMEAFAFDMFYQNLKAKGIWDKINNIYIPSLAKTLNECFCDIIGDMEYDVSNVPSDKFELSEIGGIRQIAQSFTAVNSSIMPKLNTVLGSFNDVSAICYVLDDFQKEFDSGHSLKAKRLMGFKNQLNFFTTMVGGSGKIYPSVMVTVNGTYPTISGSTVYSGLPKNGFLGFTRNSNYEYGFEFFVDGERFEIGEKKVGTDADISTLQLFGENFTEGDAGGGFTSKAPSYGMFIFTKLPLTAEEMQNLEEESNIFMQSLLL